jgi:hypothetical protein
MWTTKEMTMEADIPQVSALLTISGVSVATVVVTEVIKRTLAMGEESVRRWGPLMAVGVASVLALLGLFVLEGSAVDGEAIMQAVLAGVFGGAAAAGIFGMAKTRTPQ